MILGSLWFAPWVDTPKTELAKEAEISFCLPENQAEVLKLLQGAGELFNQVCKHRLVRLALQDLQTKCLHFDKILVNIFETLLLIISHHLLPGSRRKKGQ